MKIVVCIKQVPDTGGVVKIDPATGRINREELPVIMNPDDKAGLEAALRLKDKNPGTTVAVVSMGPPQADLVLREAMAMGADDTYLVTDRAFGGADTLATSKTIAAAIKKIGFGNGDLIITGRQAIDGDTAQVGPQIAEHLGLQNISYAEDLELQGDKIKVKRQYEDRYHIIEMKLPCLITALAELAEPRYMTPGGIFDAFREKKVTTLTRADLDIKDEELGLTGSPTKVAESWSKQLKGKGTVINKGPEESVDFIVESLRKKFVI
ncbi:MAG: electron transfer flavoprotein subunit beta [Treponemataceae bacterium]|nr:MAG: electron transfer flavoprotein subunit beta [Treponemataceae bacterium]